MQVVSKPSVITGADPCCRLPVPRSRPKRLATASVPYRRLQTAQARPHGHELKLVKNWNGTTELPKYDFGSDTLQDGSFGGDVLELQRFLNDQGYFPRLRETPDGYTGYFGDLTKDALKSWQKDQHLTADGRFGPACRHAVELQQQRVRQQHTKQQQLVQQDAHAPATGRQISPTQVAGLAFALAAVGMLGYQVWAWWRSAQQARSSQSHDGHMDQEEQLGKWQGTLADDRSPSSAPQPTYAYYPAAQSSPVTSHFAASPSYHAHPAPHEPLGRPHTAGSSTPPSSSSSAEDAAGPAVSVDGYPRYKPRWGVGLPEQKKYAPPTPARREPSDRARAVMTHPGSPGYPKAAAGGPRADGNGPAAAAGSNKADTSERPRRDHGIFGRRPKAPYVNRPRSPNPTAMPGSLNTPPPLKPTLDPSAKSWIEIAVSQRGSHDARAGPRADGRGSRLQPHQAPPGSSGSGVAQVLSVEDGHAQQAVDPTKRIGSGSSGSSHGAEASDGKAGSGKGGMKKGGGVSLFGSFKAPKRQ